MPHNATLHDWDQLETDRPMDKISRERVVGERMMISRVTLEPGFAVPMHSHVNEQIAIVIDGAFIFTVAEAGGNREITATAGQCVHLPSGLPHAGRTETGAMILDCFSPPSETTGVDRG